MIAFIHINKTAGTTLKHILRQSFGAKHCDVRVWPHQEKADREKQMRVLTLKDIMKTKLVYPHLESIAGHLVTSYSDLQSIPNLRFYTFLRNPIKRTVSHYQFIKEDPKNNESFEEWIQKPLYRNVQSQKICGDQNADKAIEIIRKFGFIGLQERFDESLILLEKWVDNSSFDIRYSSQNVSQVKIVANDILQSSTTLELIKEANEEDFKLYEFVKNELFPKQIKEFGGNLDSELTKLLKENQSFKFHESFGGRFRRKLYKLILPALSKRITT